MSPWSSAFIPSAAALSELYVLELSENINTCLFFLICENTVFFLINSTIKQRAVKHVLMVCIFTAKYLKQPVG